MVGSALIQTGNRIYQIIVPTILPIEFIFLHSVYLNLALQMHVYIYLFTIIFPNLFLSILLVEFISTQLLELFFTLCTFYPICCLSVSFYPKISLLFLYNIYFHLTHPFIFSHFSVYDYPLHDSITSFHASFPVVSAFLLILFSTYSIILLPVVQVHSHSSLVVTHGSKDYLTISISPHSFFISNKC